MPKWLYAAWTLAVLLAIVLPLAVPYAIWPPARFDGADSSGDCAGIAKSYAAAATNRAASLLWPLSVRVDKCAGTLADPQMQFQAQVNARGPYGIPFAAAAVTASSATWSESNGGAMLGLVALMFGVVAVSAPFGVVLLQRHFRAMRPASVA
jgi:hypothetical protein